jgi:hypothetical protein
LLFFAVTFEPSSSGTGSLTYGPTSYTWMIGAAWLPFILLVFSSISLDLIRPRNIISVSHRCGNCYFLNISRHLYRILTSLIVILT